MKTARRNAKEKKTEMRQLQEHKDMDCYDVLVVLWRLLFIIIVRAAIKYLWLCLSSVGSRI